MNSETYYESKLKYRERPSLEESLQADIVIVGGGLAGLALAFELAQENVNFVLIEANKIGQSASGRNGGFCSPGWAADDDKILRLFGAGVSKDFCDLSLEGMDWIKSMTKRSGFENIRIEKGTVNLFISGSEADAERMLRKKKVLYGDAFEMIGGSDLNALVNSCRYKYGLLSTDSFHLNPLEFIVALRNKIVSMGGQIFENSRMVSHFELDNEFHITLANKKVLKAKRLVIATGGYGGSEIGFLKTRWLPLQTYIAVTSGLGASLHLAIPGRFAFSDNRRAGNYFRKISGNRLLWGRDISALNAVEPKKVGMCARKDLDFFFPELVESVGGGEKISFEYIWSGKMAYSVSMLPYVRQISPKLYALMGFGGHGFNTAPIAAKILSEYLLGLGDRVKVFEQIPFTWNGGVFGPYAAEIFCKWQKTIDSRKLYSSRTPVSRLV
ncbi:MAG: FAD-binding oxidoreductase [Pseudomonadota bacterium]|nr:FAD-binding oxidoreductase [Pseudomonadota bacterium]